MRESLLTAIEEGIAALRALKEEKSLLFLEQVSELIACCFMDGGKVLIAGNGGSLCDASHFAEELTGFFREKRPALPAIALSEPGHLTCVGNDIGFEWVFARGIEALGRPGDVFIGLTTSGNSQNILRAIECAKKKGLSTVAFLGKTGGVARGMADLELVIEGFSTSDRIQEAHMAALHMIVQQVESRVFSTCI